jgi:hypothetical protein
MGKENSRYDCQPIELGFLGAVLLGSYEHISKTRVQYNDLQLFENQYTARTALVQCRLRADGAVRRCSPPVGPRLPFNAACTVCPRCSLCTFRTGASSRRQPAVSTLGSLTQWIFICGIEGNHCTTRKPRQSTPSKRVTKITTILQCRIRQTAVT